MTSATNTNKTTHKFGTVLRTIACILCITTIPNVGWGDDELFMRIDDVDWFECPDNNGRSKISCYDSAGSLQLAANQYIGVITTGITVGTDEDVDITFRSGKYAAKCTGGNNAFIGHDSGYEYWCTNSPLKKINFDRLDQGVNHRCLRKDNEYYCIPPSGASGLVDFDGSPLNFDCKALQIDRNNACFYADCAEGYEPSADETSCVKKCRGVCTNASYDSGGTEQCESVCTNSQPNAIECKHTCQADGTWGNVQIISCESGFYPVDGECKPAGCKDGNVEYNVDQTKGANCIPGQKYAKKCEKICKAASDYNAQSNPTAKHWSDTYIAECIDGATPVMGTETSNANTITMCFLDKPYNDAIEQLKKLLDDIIRKCGNDGEHIPQESESPGPEPHVPSHLT